VEVDPRRRVDDRRLGLRPRLHGRLDEDVQRPLEVDQLAAVLERDGRAARVVGHPAHDAVGLVGQGEKEHLSHDVPDPVREQARLYTCKTGAHENPLILAGATYVQRGPWSTIRRGSKRTPIVIGPGPRATTWVSPSGPARTQPRPRTTAQ